MKKLFFSLCISCTLSSTVIADEFEEVYVTADFSKTSIYDIPEAATVIDIGAILKRNAEHLEQILSYAPNVNFSAGSSRGRYFQIRGIGERSQFVDPVNPSVGLVIDGIDMTGLGGAATLFDVKQVEVLRGPQGTRFGANALAGMINVASQDPTSEFEGYVTARMGNYGTSGVGAAFSGGFSESVMGRLAIQQFKTDGYIENTFLGRDDTNNIDEIIARGKLLFNVTDDSQLAVTYLHADVENGYDAFSLDNTRETLSDEPGRDAQETNALAITFRSALSDAFDLQATLTGSQSDVEYSYDEDWTFVGIAPGWEYSSFDQYLRDFERFSADIRLSSGEQGRIFSDSTDWVVGLHQMTRDEELTRNYTFASQFNSELDVKSTAIYGELTTDLSASSRLIAGLRVENWKNDYADSNAVVGTTDENLVGGKITYENELSNAQLFYVSLARGYKAGGANSDPDVSEENREFDTEFNNVLELGFKSRWTDRLRTAVTFFRVERKDQQVKSSYAIQNEDNSFTFQDFLSNAAEGINRGLELEGTWYVSDNLTWAFSYGYLDTEFSDYSFQTADGEFSVTGRDQAHAPSYTAASSVTVQLSEAFSLDFEVESKDEFFFSDSHDLQSDAYNLFHVRLQYATEQYKVEVFGRNLGDKEYATRGFGFPNDPRDEYTSIGYTQLGEPRTYGLRGTINF